MKLPRILLIALVLGACSTQQVPLDRLIFAGADGSGQGKKVVLISGDEEYRSEEGLTHDNVIPPIMTAVLLLLVMGYAVIDFAEDKEIDVLNNTPTTVEQVSDSIFSTYIVAFEAISVLLLAALIGAIVVARKE